MKKITFFASLAAALFLLALFLPLSLLTATKAAADTAPFSSVGLMAAPPAIPLGAASPSPDGFGYTYQDEQEINGPTAGFIDISSSISSTNLTDEGHVNISIPFSFTFYGVSSSNLRVSNNGAIRFNTTSGAIGFTNYCPSSGPASSFFISDVIAPWWDDWGDIGAIYWEVQGTTPNRRLIVQWHQMVHDKDVNQDDAVTFQAILFETSNLIVFQYQDTTAGVDSDGNNLDFGHSGTVGIFGDSSTNSLPYETCDSPVLTDTRAIRFQRSRLTIAKETVNPDNNPQVFTFTGSSGISSSFTLADDSVNNSRLFNLLPGSYTVTEDTPPPTWGLSNLTCQSSLDNVSGFTGTVSSFSTNTGSRTASITSLAPGDDVTCTFTNSQLGRITIQKSTAPISDTQEFTFTTDFTSSFTLDSNPGPNMLTFADLLPGDYSFFEQAVSGWDLTGISCSDGSPTNLVAGSAVVTLAPGETVTCIFTNTKRSNLTIQKATNPAADPQIFDFLANGPTAIGSFQLDTDSASSGIFDTVNFVNILPGAYTVTETIPSGWSLTGLTCPVVGPGSSFGVVSPTININLAPGELVTCIYTNTKLARIVVDKVTNPAGNTTPFTFTTSSNLSSSSFTLSDVDIPQLFDNLPLGGGYTVTEMTPPFGWTQTGATCSDNSNPATDITLSAGEVVTCTFTNNGTNGTLIVQKVTNPPSDPQIFNFITSIAATPTFTLSTGVGPVSHTFVISPGLYNLFETPLANWDAISSCDDGSLISNIDVAPNETVTCTITNTKRAQIFVDKVTNPANAPTSFNFSLTGGPDSLNRTFPLTDTTPPYNEFIRPGSTPYALTETLVSGWNLAAPTCTGGKSVASFTVTPGEVFTCTFTNTAQPSSITVIKDANNQNQDFGFILYDRQTSPPTELVEFTLNDATSGSQTFSNLAFGNYRVTENATNPPWSLSNVTCADPSGGTTTNLTFGRADIGLDPGENVTCTFTNTQNLLAGSITIIKSVSPVSPTQFFTFTGTLPIFSLSGANDGSTDRQAFTQNAGTYVFTEQAVPGWNLSGLSCSDGSATDLVARTATVNLVAGENVTCIFTNTTTTSTPGTVYLPIILKDFVQLPNLISTLTVNNSVNPPLVTVLVQNIGDAPVNEGFWVDFYVNPSTPPANLIGRDRRWQQVSTRGIAWEVSTPLAVGGSVTLSSGSGYNSGQTNWGALPSGIYDFYAFADSYDNNDPNGAIYVEVIESNESDNQSSAAGISITGLGLEPDSAAQPDPAQFPPR